MKVVFAQKDFFFCKGFCDADDVNAAATVYANAKPFAYYNV